MCAVRVYLSAQIVCMRRMRGPVGLITTSARIVLLIATLDCDPNMASLLPARSGSL